MLLRVSSGQWRQLDLFRTIVIYYPHTRMITPLSVQPVQLVSLFTNITERLYCNICELSVTIREFLRVFFLWEFVKSQVWPMTCFFKSVNIATERLDWSHFPYVCINNTLEKKWISFLAHVTFCSISIAIDGRKKKKTDHFWSFSLIISHSPISIHLILNRFNEKLTNSNGLILELVGYYSQCRSFPVHFHWKSHRMYNISTRFWYVQNILS